jgi:hypothetical protein
MALVAMASGLIIDRGAAYVLLLITRFICWLGPSAYGLASLCVSALVALAAGRLQPIALVWIYKFVKEHTDEKGNIYGNFKATGIRPAFLAELKACGIELPASHFDPSRPL